MNNYQWLLQMDGADRKAWFDAEHVETANAALDGDTEPQNEDSRELILTDLEKKTREWHDYDGNFMRIYSDVAYAQMKELLDRQAAITKKACADFWQEIAEDRDRAQMKCAELTAERDELQAKIAALEKKLRISWEYECKFQDERDVLQAQVDSLTAEGDELKGQVFTLKGECDDLESTCNGLENELYNAKAEHERIVQEMVDANTRQCERTNELTAERDKLQEQLRIGWECECKLQAERERYREKFGKCLDYADAIHALMDDEGMA